MRYTRVERGRDFCYFITSSRHEAAHNVDEISENFCLKLQVKTRHVSNKIKKRFSDRLNIFKSTHIHTFYSKTRTRSGRKRNIVYCLRISKYIHPKAFLKSCWRLSSTNRFVYTPKAAENTWLTQNWLKIFSQKSFPVEKRFQEHWGSNF